MTGESSVQTLQVVSESITALCKDDHLAPPESILIRAGDVVIYPGSKLAPISSLLSWAEHLDGTVGFTAQALWPVDDDETNGSPTMITAIGKLGDIPVSIVAASREPLEALDRDDISVVISRADVVSLTGPEYPLGP